MEAFTYKGITDGKYVEGDIEALNIDDASFLLKEIKILKDLIEDQKIEQALNKLEELVPEWERGQESSQPS